MQQIEMLVVDDVHHGAGECGLVGRIVEKRIGGDPHLMIEDIRVELVETHGLLIGDKVYLVAFIRQGFSEFGSEYSAAAESGVTNDAYTHG
jgi:hypothetical protein